MINSEERISRLEKQVRRLTNQICCADTPIALAWGGITGDINDQTDLNDELSTIEGQIVGLQTDLGTTQGQVIDLGVEVDDVEADIVTINNILATSITGSGTANQLTYWSGASTITGSSTFTVDNTNGFLKVGINSITGTNLYGLLVGKPKIVIGDLSSTQPSFIEFGKSSAITGSSTFRGFVGLLGTREMNFGVNMDYTGNVHTQYDPALFTNYVAMNEHYFVIQAYGPGKTWNLNGEAKVVARIDNIESGNNVLGSKFTTNQLDIRDYTTTDYQNQGGTGAEFRLASGVLTIGGQIGTVRLPSGVQFLAGTLSDASPIIGFQRTGGVTEIYGRNDDANSNTVSFDFLKRRGATYGITQNDVMGRIRWNSLNQLDVTANATTIAAGAFRLGDFIFSTTNAAGTFGARMALTSEGLLGIGTTAPTHYLTFAQTAAQSGIALYKTTDQVTNFGRGVLRMRTSGSTPILEYDIQNGGTSTGGYHSFNVAGIEKMSIDSAQAIFSGHFFFGTDNAFDIGRVSASPFRPRNAFIAGGVQIGAPANTSLAAKLHLGAGTAAANTAPIRFTAGTNLTTAVAGTMEYDGTNLFFTRVGTTRESVLTGNSAAAAPTTTPGGTITNRYGGDTNFLGDPNSWASVVIGGVTYKIPLYT